ncbi:HEAT repeat-containing PBS lyase [Calothrix sp. NIES-2100]|uniref:HEAT repeat domain-containing protein n=1 Tax=Calothrix sp. NIES-2100 TaxID=1954172 RepID=UPI000B60916B|nr:HEAT repeat-containing PBS lyase [Calothrix sp. NIES-2100]
MWRNAAKPLALHADPKIILTVLLALKDEYWQVRKFAIQVLQKIPNKQSLPALIEALTDEYSDVRKEAAIALGNLSKIEALNALQQALADPDLEVSIYAQKAIQKIGKQTKI